MTLPIPVHLPGMLLREQIAVLAPTVQSPGWGETTQDWTNPTTVVTVKGTRAPVDAKSAQALHAQGITVTDTFILAPVSWLDSQGNPQGLKPAQNRLSLAGVQYVVRDVRDWGSFLEVTTEVVRAT